MNETRISDIARNAELGAASSLDEKQKSVQRDPYQSRFCANDQLASEKMTAFHQMIEEKGHKQNGDHAIAIQKTVSLNALSEQQLNDHVMALFDVISNELANKDTGDVTGITPKELQNGICKAFISKRTLQKQKKSFKFWRDAKGEKTHLVKKIGEGVFCKTYFFVDLKRGVAGAFKDARRKGFKRATIEAARPNLLNEFNMLTYVHAEGNRLGILFKPHECWSMYVQPQRDSLAPLKERFGTITLKCDHDYFTEIEKAYAIDRTSDVPIEEFLFDFYQLLAGLKNMDDLEILHGDIKPENILVRSHAKMKYVLIADFGGARRIVEGVSIKELIAGRGNRPITPGYICSWDETVSLNFAKKQNREKVIEIQKKQDVFGMGVVLYWALTLRAPYPTTRGDQLETTSRYHGIGRKDVPIELKQLIKDMLLHRYEIRPTRTEAFVRLDQLIKTNYPALHDKIVELTKWYIV